MDNVIVDELIYRSYRWNRLRRPDIKAEEWASIFNNADAMESRLQNELIDGGQNG